MTLLQDQAEGQDGFVYPRQGKEENSFIQCF